MNRYKVVGGICRLGPGQSMILSAKQYELREHNLEKLAEPSKEGYVHCRAKAPLEFKLGEEIILPELSKNLVGILEPLEVTSERDKVAAQRIASDKAAAAAPPARQDNKRKSTHG